MKQTVYLNRGKGMVWAGNGQVDHPVVVEVCVSPILAPEDHCHPNLSLIYLLINLLYR